MCKESQMFLSAWKSGKGTAVHIFHWINVYIKFFTHFYWLWWKTLEFTSNWPCLDELELLWTRPPFWLRFTLFGFSLHHNFVLIVLFHRFLGTLKQHTVQGSIHGDDDLNVEHLQLLLLLFHNLSERGRRSVLTMVTQAITDVAQSKDSQLKAVPLNLARLLLLFDYLIRHYSKAPLYLFEQVQLKMM